MTIVEALLAIQERFGGFEVLETDRWTLDELQRSRPPRAHGDEEP